VSCAGAAGAAGAAAGAAAAGGGEDTSVVSVKLELLRALYPTVAQVKLDHCLTL
jgi:hypothetical protein